MTWLDDLFLRDLDENDALEAVCLKCLHLWLESPTQLLIKVEHRDVRLREVQENLACRRPLCTHVGVRLSLISNEDTSGFVGGMP